VNWSIIARSPSLLQNVSSNLVVSGKHLERDQVRQSVIPDTAFDQHFIIDPYHTYLSLAAISIYPPPSDSNGAPRATWELDSFDPLLNARDETARWIREHIPVPTRE
jgi:hypothetical protein